MPEMKTQVTITVRPTSDDPESYGYIVQAVSETFDGYNRLRGSTDLATVETSSMFEAVTQANDWASEWYEEGRDVVIKWLHKPAGKPKPGGRRAQAARHTYVP